MPARKTKTVTKSRTTTTRTVSSKSEKTKKSAASAKPRSQNTTKRTQKSSAAERGGVRSAAVNPSWKTMSRTTKTYVLNTFDSGLKLLMHKVPENTYEEVHSALIDARNRVAVALEKLRVPPAKQDYNHLSSTLASQKEAKEHLEQRVSCLTNALEVQERELQKMEQEKEYVQDFGKLPGKHHPLLLQPLEKELYLNFT